MHLKSLILKGFKSFADKTTLHLEPGVTVVVGPNGSGKSNISDAVLWVLGEQSAKALRGQAMEDVIFAGSSARQPVGVAEVDLVLDNSDETLPLEFTEVTITRRMYRSGESEYLVNQSPCRLMDIHELLHDSGLGRDTHSIISQGQLDEILNSKPEDRRQLIEEAAGVLKHKKRKERALRKLSGMDAHLERAKDVAREIDRQLRPLKRQANRAQEHTGLTSELRELELALAVDDLRRLQATWDQVSKREKERDAEIDLLRYRHEEKEKDLDKFQALLEEKGLFVGDLSEQRRRLQSVLERLNSGLLLLEEKGKNLVERLSELRQKLHQNEMRAAGHSEELARLVDDRTDADARLKALYTSLSGLRKESEAIKKERLAADDDLLSVTGDIRRTRKVLEDARMELSKLDQSLAQARLEAELLTDREAGLKEERASIASTLSARRARLEQLDASLQKIRKERALADADVDKRVRVLESRKRDLDAIRDTLGEMRAEIRGLEEVDRAFAAASPGLAWALANERELGGIVGPLMEHIDVPKDHAALVERVLGADIFSLLVENEGAASSIAKAFRSEVDGDVTLVPLTTTRPALEPLPGAISLASLVQCEDRIRPAVEGLLGDVWLVDDLDTALASAQPSPSSRFVTSAGEILWPGAKITVGEAVSDTSSVLARKRRLNELRDEVEGLTTRVGEAEASVAETEEVLAAAQQDALDLGQQLAAINGEQESLREEVGRVEQSLTTADSELEKLRRRNQELQEALNKNEPSRKTIDAEITGAEKALAELDEKAVVAREVRDGRFREEAAVNERLSQCQVDIATVSEREVHLKRRLSTITNELDELERNVTQSRETDQALELLRERIQPIHDLYAALLERAEHWAVKLRDRAHFEQADSVSLRETIHEAQDAVKTAQSDIDEKIASMSDLHVEKGQMEVQVKTAAARIVEALGTPLEQALDSPELDDRGATEDEVHRLRKRIENIGPVNPIAMQEFDALQSRRDFLNVSIDDLVESRKALSKIIAAIDRKIKERFLETFEEVDAHFQEVFAILFPGGHSSLSLTEPDDPETTGVEVIAQPVGKKLAKMSLMSGGEKSLTALALLFAVYRTRPCPFYILDEVEAALDDTNLRRFIAFVDSMRSHTQFVTVSHQRRTMEMADVLYGVSMQADGVSKVVSQKLEREPGSETLDDHALV